jgi:hypothetical protein
VKLPFFPERKKLQSSFIVFGESGFSFEKVIIDPFE